MFRIAPDDPLVFGFGSVHGGTASNIIPDQITTNGDLRVARPEKL